MEKRKSRVESPRSSVSRSRSPLSNRSISTSPRRGPTTPVQPAARGNENDEEPMRLERELSTLGDDQKAILDESSSSNASDGEEIDPKKRSTHRHHHHRRHHHKQSKSKTNKRSASRQRPSTKRSKKESTRSKASDEEKSRSESEATKSEVEVSSSNEETEEALVENHSAQRRTTRRHHRKKRHSSSSVNERTSASPRSVSPTNMPKTTKGTQLIVNYLPSSLREADFYQLFARVAPIKLCKLITDRQTGHSHCYGFIEYHSKDDAVRAIEKYNGYKLEHKKLKVSYAQPKATGNVVKETVELQPKRSKSTTKNPNIYITDLPDNFDERMLERLFSKHGEIVKTKVLRDPRTRISRGVAFVLMTSTRYAERAVKALDGFVPSGSRTPISVKYADPNKTGLSGNGNANVTSRTPSSPAMTATIGPYGYPPSLAPYGMIDPYYAAAAMHHHHHHHRRSMHMRELSPSPPPPMPPFYPPPSRSYGSHAGSSSSRTRTGSPGLPRSYSNPSSKHNANLNQPMSSHMNSPTALAAACELIAKGCQQAIDPNGFVIYAFGLPHDCDENDLEELFRRHGEVYRVYIVRNYTTGESKGYSFITMRNYDEACHAVNRLDGSTFQGRTIQVRFKQ